MIIIPNCEILITFTPTHNYTQNLSGHLFECFDYYFHLRKFKKTKILIQEPTTHEYLQYIVRNHYTENIPDNDIIIQEHFDLIKVPIILNVDDCHFLLNKNRHRFACERFYHFACGDTKLNYRLDCDIITLFDPKVYNTPQGKSIEYTKKVYPKLNHNRIDRPFAHITKNCKSLSSELLGALIFEYPKIVIYSDYIKGYENVVNTPILDFAFSKYIYTPVSRHFDCSPRLIVECGILGIEVVLWNINYSDVGLERRLGGFEEFVLQDSDNILGILMKTK